MRVPVVAGCLVILLSGCAQGPIDDGPAGVPSAEEEGPMATPLPRTLLSRVQNSEDVPNAPRPFVAVVTVEEGYSSIFMSFMASGGGSYRLLIASVEGVVLHDTGQRVSNNEPDAHSHDKAETKRLPAPPGDYDVTVEWSGIITYHLDLIERADDGGNMEHDGH